MGTNVTLWAAFDNECLVRTFTGGDYARPYPTDGRDPSDIDVTERIYALYGLANFESQAGSVPFSGNIGLRWVTTDIPSIGSRHPDVITIDTAVASYNVNLEPNVLQLINHPKGRTNYFHAHTKHTFHL